MKNRITSKRLKLDCPLCGNHHQYEVQLIQSPLLYNPTAMHYDWRKNFGSFTKNFNCPSEKSIYQATFQIEVEGIVNGITII